MAEHTHILDNVIERINKETGEEIKVFLAIDENDQEFLFFKTEKVERGIPIDGVAHTYGNLRMFSSDSEEEAIEKLVEAISKSIISQVETLTKEKEAE